MSSDRNRKILLIIAIAVISINLRPPIAGVGPLITEIRQDTGLSNALLGMLTTLPVLCFGIFALLTPVLTRKIGNGGTMALALLILTAGILLRVIPDIIPLYLGTIVLGIGIALGNVLLPGIVKEQFSPARFGLVTGLYSSMLGVGATVASGISVPLSENLGLGWRWALGIWAIPSLIALLLWLPQLKGDKRVIAGKNLISSLRHLGTSRLAWYVSFYMGLQSFTFYVLIAWLPELLISRGMDPVRAGWMLSLAQATGAIGTMSMPAWAGNRINQKLPVAIIGIGELVSLAGLLLYPSLHLVGMWVAVLGFSSGSSFGMALLFIGLRARDTDSANELSGMSQTVGYTLAATGPALFGGLYDVSHSWTLPLILLLIVAALKLWSGWQSGQKGYV